jgi:hypothetical protein
MVVGSSVVLNTSLVEEGTAFLFRVSGRGIENSSSPACRACRSSFREIIEGVDGLMNAARRYDGEPQKRRADRDP